METNFFYNHLCHFCKIQSSDLKICSKCKTLAYCSKEHQKRDWKHHKELCEVIAQSNTMGHERFGSYSQMRRSQFLKSYYWEIKLGRELKPFERQILLYPKVCDVCYTMEKVTPCQVCFNAHYCSDKHKTKHKKIHAKHCDSLKLCMSLDIRMFHYKHWPTLTISHLTSLQKMPANMKIFMKILDNGYSDDEDSILRCENICTGCTMLYGMEKGGLIRLRQSKASLRVHVVGADSYELQLHWFNILELFFHWIINLNEINIDLVGPDLDSERSVDSSLPDFFCASCKSRNVKATLNFHKHLYSNIVNDLNEPDVVFAFNSGLHEFEDEQKKDIWRNSVQYLLQDDVPLILTAYTLDEMESDAKRVTFDDVNLILRPQKNPFGSLRPLRNWSSEEEPIFYVNGFICVLKRTSNEVNSNV